MTSGPEDLLAFQMRAIGLPTPERELPFAKDAGRGWRFDFAWPPEQLALEVEGGTRSGGRHVRHKGYEGDCEKYNDAALAGWRVLRVTTSMVRDGRALRLIEQALSKFGNREDADVQR